MLNFPFVAMFIFRKEEYAQFQERFAPYVKKSKQIRIVLIINQVFILLQIP